MGPAWLFFTNTIDFHADWRTANRESVHIAPNPQQTKEALIQVYAARAFHWRGLFAVHTWIAIKPKNALHYTILQLVGWNLYAGLSPLTIEQNIPDRSWYGQRPKIILDIRNEKAETLIPKILQTAKTYPYPNTYHYWPGPNSNTFVAYIARQIPELSLALPPNAIGKDFLPGFTFFAYAPSHTGYQISLFGILGMTIARKEGLEINILGLVFGINPFKLTLALPGIGNLGLLSSCK
ncbi:hypothetical protein AYO45_01640 [Gammaproteobacteria bacterium SCGC AG-212-F23]|nr:hypothetical protein AYO45_01640 [Gammaproteobacteria bacterium SCGC AG-212-F23]